LKKVWEALTLGIVLGSRDETGPGVPASPFDGSILLVDDEQEDALLLADLLTPLEANVVVARSAEEALRMLDRQVIDLVVTDLNMPIATGLDLAREIRKRQDVPALIFTTASRSPRDRTAAFELGAIAYLLKPIDVKQLIGLARQILLSRCAKGANEDRGH
jgi:CheY-like chemotaxis protein